VGIESFDVYSGSPGRSIGDMQIDQDGHRVWFGRGLDLSQIGGAPAPGSITLAMLSQEVLDAMTDLIHVRKTITFDGTEGNGQIGKVIVFAHTGEVELHSLHGKCTVSLGSAVAGTLALGTTSQADYFASAGDIYDITEGKLLSAGPGLTGLGGTEVVKDLIGTAENGYKNLHLAADICLDVAADDITVGELVFDLFYKAVSDDGAMAGDS